MSSSYMSQSTWELYMLFVSHQNTSEGICDALLAVSEAMGQFAPGVSMREPALVELGKHISQQTLNFIKDDVPDLLLHKRGLYDNLWSTQFLSTSSRGLKKSLEQLTMRFTDDLTNSFSESATGWTYEPHLVDNAFKELAVSFEDALGKEYDDHHPVMPANTTTAVADLSASLNGLSITSTQSPTLATSTTNTTSTRSPRTDNCFKCGQRGHWSRECPNPPVKSARPPTSPSCPSCFKCGKSGHYSNACPSLQKNNPTSTRVDCYKCGQNGHWSSSCPSAQNGSTTTPTRTRSGDKCFTCNEMGHWSGDCPRRRQSSSTPSRPRFGDKCYSCGDTGHWTNNCPRRTTK